MRFGGRMQSMARANQLLYAQRPAVVPRPAATLLLLRDGPGGLEVLMTRRSATAGFAPGAYVFPGGVVDPADSHADAAVARRGDQSPEQLTQAVAAIRESFEELGVLLARRADGRVADHADIRGMDRHAPLLAQCAARGLTLAADEVFLLAHWTTDRDLPRRFEVPFLVARMPPQQSPAADLIEQFEPVWVRPSDALEQHHAGQFFMIFPTIRTLQRLQHFQDSDALLSERSGAPHGLWSSCPRAGLLGGQEARYMEHESPFGELALVCPDGQLLHALDWQTHRPVALLKNVQRLTAPNPGAMTGPGTNSYLVGDALCGFIVIDPGPADVRHLEQLWLAAGGDIRMIVCTHSHPDHSPGAKPLQDLCRDRVGPRGPGGPEVPILGLPSAPTARASSAFTPDRALRDQELLTLGQGLDPADGHTLKVFHSPGHAANHLCLVLLEDGLLFSGDHVLNGSTTVVDPPDGNMSDYLDSLDLLAAACDTHAIDFILPAHGYVLGDHGGGAKRAIARLKQHRLQREAKVMRAMQAMPGGSLDQWVAIVYDDVPQRMWPVAKRSLLAHVQRIEQGAAAAATRFP